MERTDWRQVLFPDPFPSRHPVNHVNPVQILRTYDDSDDDHDYDLRGGNVVIAFNLI